MELTIGIPVYKNVDTLNTALKSIATQKNKEVDCKVIISEDFSTDESKRSIGGTLVDLPIFLDN